MKIEKKKFEILPEYLIIEREIPDQFSEGEFRKGFVYINRDINDELEAEGYAREIMRRVQALRKDSGLIKKDRISLFVKVNEDLAQRLEKHEDTIKDRVGADKIKISSLNPGRKHKFESKEKVKGESFELHLDKI
jgi:isoleucyl-tRNA synthetase